MTALLWIIPLHRIPAKRRRKIPVRNFGRGIDAERHGRVEPQAAERLAVIVHLDVRRVPDIRLPADLFGKLFNDVPVVAGLEFVAVSPEVEEHGIPPAPGIDEPVRELHELRVVVVAGGGEPEPVLRQVEITGAVHGPRVADAAVLQHRDAPVVVRAVGIREPPDHRPEDPFEFLPVPEHFLRGVVGRQANQRGMRIRVGRDLPAALRVDCLQPLQRHPAMDRSRRVGDILRREAPAVDVERPLQAVFFSNFNQLLILLDPVVVAQGQRLGQPSRETHDQIRHNRFSPCTVFSLFTDPRHYTIQPEKYTSVSCGTGPLSRSPRMIQSTHQMKNPGKRKGTEGRNGTGCR